MLGNQLTYASYPNELCHNFELQNPSPDVPELHKIRGSSDLEAQKL